jgi:hypothetical protein
MNLHPHIFRGSVAGLLIAATAFATGSNATTTRSAGVHALAVTSSSSGGSVSLSGWATFSGAVIASGTSRVGASDPTAGISGADLIGAQLVYRPELADFFIRWQVASSCTQCGIPSVGVAPATVVGDPRILYVLRATIGGTPVEVRVQSLGATQVFGLFVCQTEAACTLSQSLQGGYGTTGEEVVADLPLSTLAAAGIHVGEGSKIAAPITAFTAIAPYAGPEEIPQEYEDSIAMTHSATVTVPVKSVRVTANRVTRVATLKNGYFTVTFPRSALPHGRTTTVTTRTCLGASCVAQKFAIHA